MNDGISEWIELCSDSKDDWNSFTEICAAAFVDSAAFNILGDDPQKKKIFMLEYFKHVYETELSGGRGGLVCAKRAAKFGEERRVETMYVNTCVYNAKPPKRGDPTRLRQIDEAVAELCLREDQWIQDNVLFKFREIAKMHDFELFYGHYHAMAGKFRGLGKAKKYFPHAARLLFEDGKRRGLVDRQKLVVEIGIIDDVKSINFLVGFEILVHTHIVHSDENVVCVDDPNNNKEQEYNCIFVQGRVIGKSPAAGLLDKIRQCFNAM